MHIPSPLHLDGLSIFIPHYTTPLPLQIVSRKITELLLSCRIRINFCKTLALIWNAVLALWVLKKYSQARINISYATDARNISWLAGIFISSRAAMVGLRNIVASLVLEISCCVSRRQCCSTSRNYIAIYWKIVNFVGFRCLYVSYYTWHAILS